MQPGEQRAFWRLGNVRVLAQDRGGGNRIRSYRCAYRVGRITQLEPARRPLIEDFVVCRGDVLEPAASMRVDRAEVPEFELHRPDAAERRVSRKVQLNR